MPCPGQRRRTVLPTATMTSVWRSAILAALAGMMRDHRLTQHLTQPRWPQSETKLEPDRGVYLAKRASFIEELAKLLCWAHLERSLRQSNSTPKQVAAQMREYRKRHWRDTSRELQTDVCASLSAESSHDLEHMGGGYALRFWTMNPPLNDLRWIMGLASQPGDLLPDRSLGFAAYATLAGVKELEPERPVFWPRLPLSWRTTRSTSWRSGCFGFYCPATNSLKCSSGFGDMPEPRAPLVLPPLPLARSPGPAWIDRRRLWRCWRFKTETQGVRPRDASVSFRLTRSEPACGIRPFRF